MYDAPQVDEAKAHALALAANDEAIDQAVRDGRLTPAEGMALKFDDSPRVIALVDKAIADYYERHRIEQLH